MRPSLLAAVALIGMPPPTPRAHAIDVVLQATRLAQQMRPPWWRWTVVLAGAITCKRIEAA